MGLTAFLDTFQNQLESVTPFTIYQGKVEPLDSNGNQTALTVEHFPYVVLSAGKSHEITGNDRRSQTLFDSVVHGIDLSVRVTMAGMSVESVDIVQSRVRSEMNRSKLLIEGWQPTRLRMSPVLQADRDESVSFDGMFPWYAIDEYSIFSGKLH